MENRPSHRRPRNVVPQMKNEHPTASRRATRRRRTPLPILALNLAIVLSVAGGSAAYGVLSETVTLTVEGKSTTVRTFGGTVSDVLETQDVKVLPGDKISHHESTEISEDRHDQGGVRQAAHVDAGRRSLRAHGLRPDGRRGAGLARRARRRRLHVRRAVGRADAHGYRAGRQHAQERHGRGGRREEDRHHDASHRRRRPRRGRREARRRRRDQAERRRAGDARRQGPGRPHREGRQVRDRPGRARHRGPRGPRCARR